LQKPDSILRYFPLDKVIEASKSINNVVLLHPLEIYAMVPRQRCFCGRQSSNKMVLCESCNEWYHLDCVGLGNDEATMEHDWKCGYCTGVPDGDGNCVWSREIPQNNRKTKKVALVRNIRDTPKNRGIIPDGDEEVPFGPSTWDDIVHLTREGGKKINAEMASQKARAKKIIGTLGHHVGDAMSGDGLAEREVTDAVVDDMIHDGYLPELGEDEALDDQI
jgi:ArsR family metal-binding transcriptional regulator